MESTQNLILEKYQMSDLPGDNLTHKLENVKKLVKEEIRKELKIKEGKNKSCAILMPTRQLDN